MTGEDIYTMLANYCDKPYAFDKPCISWMYNRSRYPLMLSIGLGATACMIAHKGMYDMICLYV